MFSWFGSKKSQPQRAERPLEAIGTESLRGLQQAALQQYEALKEEHIDLYQKLKERGWSDKQISSEPKVIAKFNKVQEIIQYLNAITRELHDRKRDEEGRPSLAEEEINKRTEAQWKKIADAGRASSEGNFLSGEIMEQDATRALNRERKEARKEQELKEQKRSIRSTAAVENARYKTAIEDYRAREAEIEDEKQRARDSEGSSMTSDTSSGSSDEQPPPPVSIGGYERRYRSVVPRRYTAPARRKY